MGVANIFNTGYSGLGTSRAQMATTGHNITNASSDGFSRQRVVTENIESGDKVQKGVFAVGLGARVARVERVNDEYLEKQIRNTQRELSYHEEKEMGLKQVEDIFNEMNGDGISRLMTRFFNDMRKLADEPESRAMRESLRESTQAMAHQFRLIRSQLEEVRQHFDSRIEGYVGEANILGGQIVELNHRIHISEASGGTPNDLMDKRDLALKKLASLLNINTQKDTHGNISVDIRGGGSFLTENTVRNITVERSGSDDQGKADGSFSIRTLGGTMDNVTHLISGGKLGALIELRDRTISQSVDRLDELAFTLSQTVNAIHSQGVTANGATGVNFFKPLLTQKGAAEAIGLSAAVESDVNAIATGFELDAPGDNRVILAITELQGQKLMGDGHSTLDEWYNSVVSDVGVLSSKNRFGLNQQKDIMSQMGKMRDQISGVSIDEESANLMQFQHVFEASAKVIEVAEEMLKTILALKRD